MHRRRRERASRKRKTARNAEASKPKLQEDATSKIEETALVIEERAFTKRAMIPRDLGHVHNDRTGAV